MKINFVYVGVESDNDLYDLMDFAMKRNVILVVLPVIYNECDYISLKKIYCKFKEMGIESEFNYLDEEGIEKKLINLVSGVKIILRVDELADKKPYKFCFVCDKIKLCKEGIFPLRLTVSGDLLLCLASGHKIPVYDAITSRNDEKIIDAFNTVRSWSVE